MRVSRILCVAALVACPAWATTMLRAGIEELTRQSNAIVRGTVVRVEPHWTGDHLRIVTDVEIQVSEALKGSPPKLITVRQLGGIVGNIGQRVGGVARFTPGEEVLVFLEQRGPHFILAGMAQGKLRIRDGVAVPEPVEGATLLDPGTRQPTSPQVLPIKLDELKTRIRAVILNPNPVP